MSELKEVKKAGERYALIHKFLIDKNDNFGLELLDDLIDACKRYAEFVSSMEKRIQLIKYKEESWDVANRIEELDKNRRIIHDALISKLYALNRYLFKTYKEIPISGIYSLDPETIRDRAVIGDWVGYLTEYLATR